MIAWQQKFDKQKLATKIEQKKTPRSDQTKIDGINILKRNVIWKLVVFKNEIRPEKKKSERKMYRDIQKKIVFI